ncbi:MAG: TldD/PmbA family protein [Actinobacteria bacterium]|nr:MAG: TldD/PmbA family protein [Actinomycetota bacterium]
MERRKDLRELALEWVQRGRPLVGAGVELEIFVQEHRGLTVKAFGGEVEGLRYSHSRGVGVRALREGRLGYSYCTGLGWEDVKTAVEVAAANSLFSTADEYNLLPGGSEYTGEDLCIYDPETEETDSLRKVEMALELERLTLSRDPRVSQVETAVYADTVAHVAVASTAGVAGNYRSSDCYCYVFPIAREGDEYQTGFSFDLGVRPSDLDLGQVAAEASERALCLLGSRSMPSRRTTLVLDSFVAAEFLGMLAAALSAEAVLKGRSFLAGKVGETIAAPTVSIIDDGLLRGAPSTAPFDDEGVPSQRKELIGGGVLNGYLHNTYTAARSGTASTGNASRGSFRDRPRVGASNMFLQPGRGGREEIMRQVGEGVLVLQVVGAHAGANPVSGEISLGALGLQIENGAPVRPLREITLAGKALDFLRGIVAIGEDLRFLPFEGSLGAPTVAIADVMVAGRG